MGKGVLHNDRQIMRFWAARDANTDGVDVSNGSQLLCASRMCLHS